MVDEDHKVNMITIKGNEVTVYPNNAGNCFVYWLDSFIGDRIYDRDHYDMEHPEALVYVDGILKEIHDYDFKPTLNCHDTYWAVSAAKEFLELTNGLKAKNTLQIMEEMRIKHEIEIWCSIEDGFYKYFECKTMRSIMFSVFHYLVMNGKCLKKCNLCGKWFVPKEAQENFCCRSFEYTNWQGKLKKYDNCQSARTLIIQSLKARRNKIKKTLEKRVEREGVPFVEIETVADYQEALKQYPANRIFDSFKKEWERHEKIIKTAPSIENLMEYEKFLYVACEQYYKRYARKEVKQ